MYFAINISINKSTVSDETSTEGVNKKIMYNHNNKYSPGKMY
jgi:hypothetical protein